MDSPTGSFAPLVRRLPHNVDAEMALLGAILVNNRAYDRVSEFIRPEHFVVSEHVKIYDAVVRLKESGRTADPVTLKDMFERDQSLSAIGGVEYLLQIAECATTVINAEQYGRLILDLAQRRELIAIGQEIVNRAYDSEIDELATTQIEDAESALHSVADRGAPGTSDPKSARDAMLQAFAAARHASECRASGTLPGVSTGITDLDDATCGLHQGDLTIIAGRPSMGKTEMAVNVALNVAAAYRQGTDESGRRVVRSPGVVAFFSLEMRYDQLGARLQARSSRIGSHQLRSGKLTIDQLSDAESDAIQRFGPVPLFIDDRSALTVSAIRAQARRIKRKNGLHLVVIDYLQLVTPPSALESASELAQLSHMTRSLKQMAKELDVPVVCLSQLSRAVEQRDDKRPQLSDLRSSGTIEQDADNVLFVYRESYYLERSEPQRRPSETDEKFADRHQKWMLRLEETRNVMDLIIAKQRMGPLRTVKMFCDLSRSYIGNLSRQNDMEEVQ